tara:strand:+ start:117 stop:320 length:204 start_codon:yes stop_codon:yes gene_type:complete
MKNHHSFDPIKAVQEIRDLASKVTGEGNGSREYKIALVALGNLVNGRESLDDTIIAFEDLRDNAEVA